MSKTEKLIELVYKYPILYNLSHEDYRNSRKKDKIWTEIGIELNESGEELKRKWKNLKDSYAKYIRNTSTKTGQTVNNTKQWIWADRMTVFRPFLNFTKTSSNINDIKITELPPVLNSTPSPEHLNPTSLSEILNSTHSSEHLISTLLPEVLQSNSLPSTEMPTQNNTEAKTATRHIKKNNPGSSSSLRQIINYFNRKEKIEHDDTDCLFLAHSKTIKKFSAKRQAITKFKIAQIIMAQEILNLEDQESTNRNE